MRLVFDDGNEEATEFGPGPDYGVDVTQRLCTDATTVVVFLVVVLVSRFRSHSATRCDVTSFAFDRSNAQGRGSTATGEILHDDEGLIAFTLPSNRNFVFDFAALEYLFTNDHNTSILKS